MRPCDRCEASSNYDSQADDCVEFQFGSGIIAWLCFTCRQQWTNKVIDVKCFDLMCELEKLSINLEYKMDLVGQEEAIEATMEKKHAIERQLRVIAKEWLRDGK